MQLETKNFKKKDLCAVKKALNEELGLDFETNIDEYRDCFTITVLDIETRSEINTIARIEDRFNANDDFLI